MKDWNGNQNSIYKTLGASNHTEKERQLDDYYATEPKAAELLLEQEEFHHTIWECACGEGHLARVFEEHGHEVISTDLVYRGYGDPEPLDFLNETIDDFEGDVITNPPYKFALEFVQRALDSIKPGRKVAMFLKLQFLEGKSRKNFFQITPPRRVYVSSSRLKCAKNGEFESISSSAVAYAWFVWKKGYTGETVVKWIN
nr:MAG TPA: adenine-specific methyltransferase [Caudoviricetes sp.]